MRGLTVLILSFFARFPVDEQYCQIKFESFGFTNKQVRINQHGINFAFEDSIVHGLVLPPGSDGLVECFTI